MGLAINSNFSAVAYGSSASMKNYQGAMSKSLTKISTGKRYMGGGVSASAVTTSVKHKKSAADYEASYYDLQETAADYATKVSGLEALLEAAIESESTKGDTTDLTAVISKMAASVSQSSAKTALGATLTQIIGGTTSGAVASQLTSAYGTLSALDYASTFLQNMAGAEQAAYSAVTDTDIAIEMSKYVKANINMQAAQAMVSQANQSTASMLNLLQF